MKPFHYPELVARVAAVLRRREGRREGPLRVGELVIDPVTRRVRVGDREVALANKEFALLRALASEPRRVFTKDELLRDVWGFKSQGPHPDPRLPREPPAAKARPRGLAVRLQLLGRRLPAGRRLMEGRRMISPGHRRRLNRALHELRRPLQALALLDDGSAAVPPRLRPAPRAGG